MTARQQMMHNTEPEQQSMKIIIIYLHILAHINVKFQIQSNSNNHNKGPPCIRRTTRLTGLSLMSLP